jgi:hypothetical protein
VCRRALNMPPDMLLDPAPGVSGRSGRPDPSMPLPQALLAIDAPRWWSHPRPKQPDARGAGRRAEAGFGCVAPYLMQPMGS